MKRIFLILLFLLSCTAQAKQTICLNMIVKNESAVIKRCLDSVKPLIDHWVIVDTGSTDGTQDVIREHMKDIPGELHERPWKNFGHNRTEAIELAKEKADFILFMDADDWLEYDQDFQIPHLRHDVYHIWKYSGSMTYTFPQLVRASLPWKWVGVLHEYPDCGRPAIPATLEGVRYIYGADGASAHDPNKFDRYIEILKQGLIDEPGNSRYVFYLGESYRCAGKREDALEWYQKRVELGGWQEEVFWSKLQIACLKYDMNYPVEEVIDEFYRAHRYRPHRVEPVYFLAEIFNKNDYAGMAYETIRGREFTIMPNEKDRLFNIDWMERWGLDSQLSIASYWVEKYQECVDSCEKLLSYGGLPDNWRHQTELNRSYALAHLESPPPVPQVTPRVRPDGKSVMLAILVRNKAHVLPYFMKCVEELDYPKELISIYFNTNDNVDSSVEIIKEWMCTHHSEYAAIVLEEHTTNATQTDPHEWNADRFELLGKIRNKSLRKTLEMDCDYYFTADVDTFFPPDTLKTLIEKDKPIIAPLLEPMPNDGTMFRNYFCEVDERGYYQHHPNYYSILHRNLKGTFEVPLVHICYLIKAECVDKLSYTDGSGEWEFIVFGRSARENGIKQYLCNEIDFGTFLWVPKELKLEEEVYALDTLMEKHRCLHFHDTNNAVEKDFEMCLTSRPKISDKSRESGKGLYTKASGCRKIKLYPEALEAYELAVSKQLASDLAVNAYLEMGNLRKMLEKSPESTFEAYSRAYRLAPQNPDVVLALAKWSNENGFSQLAYTAIKATGPPSSSGTLDLDCQLALACFNTEKYEEFDRLCEALLLNPSLPDAMREDLTAKFSQNTPAFNKDKAVLIAILARDKGHVLPLYLKCIENLDYDKSAITIYINTNDNRDNTVELLEAWAKKHESAYANIIFDNHMTNTEYTNPHAWTSERVSVLAKIRNKSMRQAQVHNCEYYFVVDCDNFIAPHTLKTLIEKDKPIIAPMLRAIPIPGDSYSNYFCAVDANGYYQNHPDYFRILNREIVGTFDVPLVHCTYLIKSEHLDDLSYIDDSGHMEFVVFSRSARESRVQQYICNEEDFGKVLIFYATGDSGGMTLEEECIAFNAYLADFRRPGVDVFEQCYHELFQSHAPLKIGACCPE